MRNGVALAFAGLTLTAAALWFTVVGTEPDERVRELQADSARMHAELVVLRDSVRVYRQWVDEATARFGQACRMLPFRTPDECRYMVDTRIRRRGTR